MRYELKSYPKSQIDLIAGCIEGANAVLANIPNATGNDPMRIVTEHKDSGNVHIYLEFGRWVGSFDADFS